MKNKLCRGEADPVHYCNNPGNYTGVEHKGVALFDPFDLPTSPFSHCAKVFDKSARVSRLDFMLCMRRFRFQFRRFLSIISRLFDIFNIHDFLPFEIYLEYFQYGK